MLKMKIIGLSGFARSGKDSFFSLMSHFYNENHKIKCKRFALADALKQDMDGFLTDKLGISAFTTNEEEKNLIRPLLVEYGRCKRIQTNGTYWTSLLFNKIQSEAGEFDVAVVTDIRYAAYDEDEVFWLKNLGGKLIHISQYKNESGVRIYKTPPNKDEVDNDPVIQKLSNYKFEWETASRDGVVDYDFMYGCVVDFLEENKNWKTIITGEKYERP